jgi:hypothetical protein
MMRRFPLSVVLTVLIASTAEAQTTTSTTSQVSSSPGSSPALAVGPLATSGLTLPTPSALGVSQALPGSANSGGSSAAAGTASAPSWLLCLPDAPDSEVLLFDSTLSCAP